MDRVHSPPLSLIVTDHFTVYLMHAPDWPVVYDVRMADDSITKCYRGSDSSVASFFL